MNKYWIRLTLAVLFILVSLPFFWESIWILGGCGRFGAGGCEMEGLAFIFIFPAFVLMIFFSLFCYKSYRRWAILILKILLPGVSFLSLIFLITNANDLFFSRIFDISSFSCLIPIFILSSVAAIICFLSDK